MAGLAFCVQGLDTYFITRQLSNSSENGNSKDHTLAEIKYVAAKCQALTGDKQSPERGT